ncbi:MAG: hypothetical protein RSF35_04120 [Akkermansia sp.]
MTKRLIVEKEGPFILRDNNGNLMDFNVEIVYLKENKDESFLWIKSTKNDEAFNILKSRLKKLFEINGIKPNVFIFKNTQGNGSNRKYWSFEIVSKGEKNIDDIDKYYNGNYNSIFISLFPFKIDILSKLEFPMNSENETSREGVILKDQKPTILSTISENETLKEGVILEGQKPTVLSTISENETLKEGVILEGQKPTILSTILDVITTLICGYGLYRYFKRRR